MQRRPWRGLRVGSGKELEGGNGVGKADQGFESVIRFQPSTFHVGSLGQLGPELVQGS